MATGRIPSVQNASTLAGATLATNVTASSLTSFGTSPALTTPTISTATTNGDILYGTGSGAIARLGIGSSAQVLTVASGIPSWATPASGSGLTLISTTTFSAQSSQAFDNCFTATYDNYIAVVDVYDNGISADLRIQLRTSAPATIATNYTGAQQNLKYDGTESTNLASNTTLVNTGANGFASTIRNSYRFMFYKPLTTRQQVSYEGYSQGIGGSMFGAFTNTSGSAAAGFILSPASSTISGTVSIYGLAK